jgi:hypothetical protein
MWPTTFVRTLWKSITSLEYYFLTVRRAPWHVPVRFFLCSFVLCGFLQGMWMANQEFPQFVHNVQRQVTQLPTVWPHDLVISRTQGALVVQPNTPLRVAWPDETNSLFGGDAQFAMKQYMLEVDAAAKPEAAFATINSEGLTLALSEQEGRSLSWSDLVAFGLPGTWRIDKENVGTLTTTVNTTLDQVVTTVRVVWPLIFAVSLTIVQAIGVCVDSLLFLFFARLSRTQLTGHELWRMLVHVSVVAGIVATLTYPFAMSFPIYGISFWVYAMAVYISVTRKLQRHKTT